MKIWEDIGEELKENIGIIVAKIESIKNEIENLPIDKFPVVKFFLRGRKNEPIDYFGPIKKEAILSFVKEFSKLVFYYYFSLIC